MILGISDAQDPSIRKKLKRCARCCPTRSYSSAKRRPRRCSGAAARTAALCTSPPTDISARTIRCSHRSGSENSHLSLYDMYHLQLPAELVVLSGCATGLNVVTPGDELIGLVRGLLQAGAQSLVLSLWDVHDESTKDFMIAFYTQLAAGHGEAAAMQAAMVELREAPPPSLPLGSFLIDRKGVSGPKEFFTAPIFFADPCPPYCSEANLLIEASSEWSIFPSKPGPISYAASAAEKSSGHRGASGRPDARTALRVCGMWGRVYAIAASEASMRLPKTWCGWPSWKWPPDKC